ncbi:SymE family type I addiction module toxin [Edaphocola flava]|uniref:SymE family type I addiction module toxin n=1 Tax=Edaphocola flava TaxID=2499629 RepID=UPI00192A3116|nr:SymE family type I addiction module toxin [Edaphocola flava]
MAKKPNSLAAKKARIVKIYDRMVFYGGNVLYKTRVVYPMIRISGQWLADCGFAPGQHIQVTPGKQRLVIQLVNAPAADQNAAATKLNAVAEKLPAAVR